MSSTRGHRAHRTQDFPVGAGRNPNRLEVELVAAPSPTGVPTSGPLRKAFAVLEILAGSDRPLTLSELARRWGQPKSSVHRMLHVLLGLDLATLDGNHYALGNYLFDVLCPSDWARAEQLRRVLMPHLVELQQRTSAVVTLAVLSGPNVRFVDLLYQHGQSAFARRLPQTAPRVLHGRGPGAAHLPANTPQYVESATQTGFTPHTNTDPAVLLAELLRVRDNGVAKVNREYPADAIATAAPIRVADRAPFLAVGVTYDGSMDLPLGARMVKHVADRASAAISSTTISTAS